MQKIAQTIRIVTLQFGLLLFACFQLVGAEVILRQPQLASTNRVYRFSFETIPDVTYPIEVSSDMVSWTLLTNLTAVGVEEWLEDTNFAGSARRFYHVGIAPKPRAEPIPIEKMVFIPSGTFTMGSPDSEAGRDSKEGPQTQVTISRGFWMGKYEVTQYEYLIITGVPGPATFNHDYRLPVDFATWNVANDYCRQLTAKEKIAGHLPEGWIYRLPTEAEWEYACRGGSTNPISLGNGISLSSSQANFDGGFPYGAGAIGPFRNFTTLGGTFAPNAWGLYDMHGNVWEWCQDYYGPYPGGAVADPTGPATGTTRVLRGGGFTSVGKACRSAKRDNRSQTYGNFGQGFRAVLAREL